VVEAGLARFGPVRSDKTEPRVALVHDWLTVDRGAEKVLLELCRLFPSARIHTLLWNRGSVDPEIERRVVQTSFLQKLPGAAEHYRSYLPLFPRAIESLKIRDADLVISSSHAVAKSVIIPEGARHVSYIHTPMRYLWGDTESYFQFGRSRRMKKLALRFVSPYLRRFDQRTAKRVEFFIANSENVRERIRRVYDADSTVIYPPVDTDYYRPDQASNGGDYYLVVSALEPHKRIDLAVRAFAGSPRSLVIAGAGTQEAELRSIATDNVTFAGRVSNAELRKLYRGCRAVILPGIEDFGIVPVEAQACGKPVVCCAEGGARESVIEGETGVYFWPQWPAGLQSAVAESEQITWDPAHIRRQSLRFSRQCFRDRMKRFFESRLGLVWEAPTPPAEHSQEFHFA
jgi:glycosyltransferase involved in cell wall biosynthesis